MIKIVEINGTQVWLYVDRRRVIDTTNRNLIQEVDKYLCFFKFSEPTPFVQGKIIKDSDGKPNLFNSVDDAVQTAKSFVKSKFKL